MKETQNQPVDPTQLNETLEEREDILYDELELAIQWDRPSILIAVYESEFTRKHVEESLEVRLSKLGQGVLHFHIDEKLFDVPMILVQNPNHETTVYFITGLKWGGGKGGFNAYRALNMRREFFVDNCMRVILWLTRSEATHLPRHAPDFWAFRHRVVELMDSQTGQIDRKLNIQITWDGWKSSELRMDAAEKIRLRESMLEELPSGDESQSSRMDLIYSLASYQWAKEDFAKSLKLLNEGLDIASGLADRISESQFLAGMGIVNHSKGNTKEAVDLYEQSVGKNPYNSYAWNNLAIAYYDTGESEKAVQVCKQSIEAKSKNTIAYSILGDLYRQMGRLEDAKDCIAVTTKLEPKVALHWINLGDVYIIQKRDKEALRAYLKASRLSQDDPEVWKRLGKVYSNSNRTKEARKAINNALALSPDDAEAATLLERIETQE